MREGERRLQDMLIRPENPGHDATEARTKELMEKASVGGALSVIDELILEVEQMPIADRSKKTGKIGEHIGHHDAHIEGDVRTDVINPAYKDLPEAEFKRQQLLSNLQKTRQQILNAVGGLENIVMDIEATKTDG